MWVLAADLSTAIGSLAVLKDNDVRSDISWEQTRTTNQRLFKALRDLVMETGISLSDIDLFCVGLGPGAFSGIRISLTALSALAMPTNRPVLGVSSSMALALGAMEKYSLTSVTLIGDARRDRLWMASYSATAGPLDMTDHFDLCTWNDLRKHVPPDSTIVTADWNRIGERLGQALGSGTPMVRETVTPPARMVARVARERFQASPLSHDPDTRHRLSPIYLHPPVSTPPRLSKSRQQ